MTRQVITRGGWSARPPSRSIGAAPAQRDRLVLHHTSLIPSTVGLGADAVRWVQQYHMRSNGWADIGYTALYSPATRDLYLGRAPSVAGAHTPGQNTTAHALAVIGDYHRPVTDGGDTIPASMVADLAWCIQELRDRGLIRRAWIDGGHRDHSATACPGDRLYRLIDAINVYRPQPHEVDTIREEPIMADLTDDQRTALLAMVNSTIRPGDEGNYVALVQRGLIEWCERTGRQRTDNNPEYGMNPDGRWGAYSARVYAEWRRAAGMPPTAIVEPMAAARLIALAEQA